MILDPNGIAGATGAMAGAGAGQVAETKAVREGHGEEKTSLLVFRAGGADLKAVPLALVARLEEIEVSTVENSHGSPVVQYRGHLMPLVTIDGSTMRDEGRQPVLVFSDRDRSMGMVVDEIVDIVEERLKVELTADRPGLIGTAVIAGKATDIIDAGYYLPQAFGDWFGAPDKEYGHEEGEHGKRILLVDDSPFFRNLLTPLLSVAGYEVTSVESADRALAMREAGNDFDIIISDIEMPGMNGFDFAQAVRAEGRWQDTPLVALSSHATEKDFERGRMVGFNDYVAKFDRDALLQTLAQTLSHEGDA
jgi:two-component system chemotaxis sensor kinase CheA